MCQRLIFPIFEIGRMSNLKMSLSYQIFSVWGQLRFDHVFQWIKMIDRRLKMIRIFKSSVQIIILVKKCSNDEIEINLFRNTNLHYRAHVMSTYDIDTKIKETNNGVSRNSISCNRTEDRTERHVLNYNMGLSSSTASRRVGSLDRLCKSKLLRNRMQLIQVIMWINTW